MNDVASGAFALPSPHHAYQGPLQSTAFGVIPKAYPNGQAFMPGPHAGYPAPAIGNTTMMMPSIAGQYSVHSPAPFSQSVPAQAAGPPQSLLQPNVRSQQPTPPKQHTPPAKYPMAAPSLPHSPPNRTSVTSNGAAASPKSPQSPGAQSREPQRIALLLEINAELLQEVNRLQTERKGGACTPQQQAQLRAQGHPDTMASEEYIQTLRRVQANLSYLMPKAQTSHGDQHKAPPGPAHMTPPAHMPQLQPMYDELKELFPGWHGLDNRLAQSASSPRSAGPNASNGIAAPQLPTAAPA